MTVANAPIKVELQGLTAQSTMEAEPVAAALTMKDEAVFCSNIMSELGFGESFGSVPLHIDNTSALYIAGNHTFIPRTKHIALRYYFFVQELVEGKVSIHYVKSENQLADLCTKHHSKHRHRDLIKFVNDFDTPISSSTTNGSHHLPARGILAYCSPFSAYFVVIYRGAPTLHCTSVVGSSH